MSAARNFKPLDLLRDIEARSQRNALGIPQQVEVRRTWSGIGFRLGDTRMVSALDEVNEILPYPALTRVPGALPWVKGLANIRGTLLPVMDLAGLLEGDNTRLDRQTRILVINQGDVTAGLVVNEALGLRHFFEEEKTERIPKVSEPVRTHLVGAYQQGSVHWGVFSVQRLIASSKFMQVAARG
ncbi:MAG: purine-binding chemotaxis protein CheW [Pseudomonadota bacterium]|nr:MAG: purine-binding chemotaxis protein CheW [Pseudomonadota bacterium]